jgi:hypothetical protein
MTACCAFRSLKLVDEDRSRAADGYGGVRPPVRERLGPSWPSWPSWPVGSSVAGHPAARRAGPVYR